MAVQGFDCFAALEAHHLPGMVIDHQRALLLRVAGRSHKEASVIELVSESTMKNRVAIASSEIAMGLRGDRRLSAEQRGYWVSSHRKCCLVRAMAVLGGLPS